MSAPTRTALSRANRTREIAMAGAWREVAAHLSAATEVCREIEAEDSNGDTGLARAVRSHVAAELAKVEERLGELPVTRPPEPWAGEAVDEQQAAKVREARAMPPTPKADTDTGRVRP